MNISKRLYTYPVLSDETRDYENKAFNVKMHYEMESVDTIEFDFEFELSSSSLQEMINNKSAEFMIHAECSETSYRHAFRTFAKRTSFAIPLKEVNGTIDFVAFIVAKKDISKFSSQEWCEDFDDMTFNIEKGSILAYQNLEDINVTKDYEDFTDSSSIISISKLFGDHPMPSEVDLDGKRIKILLYEDDYNEYFKKKEHNPELLPILNTMIIFPALVHTFNELRDEDKINDYSNKNWFISLEKAFEKRGKDFKEELLLEDNTGYSIAQEVLELPIGKALLQLNELLKDSGDQEDEE